MLIVVYVTYYLGSYGIVSFQEYARGRINHISVVEISYVPNFTALARCITAVRDFGE